MSDWPATPFYLYDEAVLHARSAEARVVADAVGARLLYSVKACAVGGVVEQISQFVDGFSCSSLFEARAVASLRRAKKQSVHFCAPSIRPADITGLKVTAGYVTFNSLPQWRRLREEFLAAAVLCGLRLNPQLSFADDPRYDPCRPASKLGVVADDIQNIATTEPGALEGITGLHFHNNSDSSNLAELAETVDSLGQLPPLVLDRLSWLNIGGGYFLHQAVGADALNAALRRFRARRSVEVFFEPGAAFVREAGLLFSRVVDVFTSQSTNIAVLDSSVNHFPNFLTYGSKARVASPAPGTGYRYALAGATCLAGDLFGEFDFGMPIEVGEIVVMDGVGAYGLVKMHMFNGVPVPDVYLRREDGGLQLLNSGTYGDYLRIYVGL